MKKLTGWAAIIAVPTLVTSFVGMNVAFPLEGTAAGFWLYLAIMVVSGGGPVRCVPGPGMGLSIPLRRAGNRRR